MELNRRLLGALATTVLALLGGAAAARETPDAVWRRDATALMRRYGVPGMAIAVTDHGHRRFVNLGVASRASRDPVTSDTLFEIGSLSKTFTATLASTAVVAGRLALADSPARYFPALAGHALEDVTLLELGTHTAGGFPMQVPDGIATRAELMRYFQAWTPQDPPGTVRTYANPSIGLFGMVAAQALGLPFKAAMEEHLLPQLGLHDTFIDVPPARMPAYAQGYDARDAPVRVHPGVIAEEAYGIKTSARDLLRFVELNIDPSSLDPDLASALRATQVGYFQVGAMTQDLVWEQYALPVALPTLLDGNGPRLAYRSNPATRLAPPRPPQSSAWLNKTGSTNGFGAYAAFVPGRGKGIVILANKSLPNEARVRLAYAILSIGGGPR